MLTPTPRVPSVRTLLCALSLVFIGILYTQVIPVKVYSDQEETTLSGSHATFFNLSNITIAFPAGVFGTALIGGSGSNATGISMPIYTSKKAHFSNKQMKKWPLICSSFVFPFNQSSAYPYSAILS